MDTKRMIDNFIKLIKINSPSSMEKEVSEYIKNELIKRDFKVHEDEGFKNYGGNGPCLFAKLEGNKNKRPITFQAHMDVVGPNENVNPIISDKIVKTDGTTTLGADDKAGIAIIFEVIDSLFEEKIDYPDIFVVITTCEETGLLGAKNVQWDMIPKDLYPYKDMIVIDNAGRSGLIAYQAPSLVRIKIKFLGKKAHAGIEPEKGISAIYLASCAISNFKLGRISENTTANIGSINSNFPTNVVADTCEIELETRSHSDEVLTDLVESYRKSCDKAVSEIGGSFIFDSEIEFPRLNAKDDLKFAKEFEKEYKKLGIETKLQVIGGGSDANIFSGLGFNSIIVSCGMYDVHTTDEYLVIEDMENTAKASISYIKGL